MRSAALGLVALVLAASAAMASAPERPHLWYVGLGMQDESWSGNDVTALAGALERSAPRYQVSPVVLSNDPTDGRAVTGAAVEQTIQSIAARVGPGDVVVVYASTHGAPGLLGRREGGREQRPVDVEELRRWLAPLRGQDTVVILSACFAGSFIPGLQGEHRIIFAAARADRTSFGCRAGAEHTVFGEALLRALGPERSLHSVFEATRTAVRATEQAMHYGPPSLPQISVGPAMRGLYEAPSF